MYHVEARRQLFIALLDIIGNNKLIVNWEVPTYTYDLYLFASRRYRLG